MNASTLSGCLGSLSQRIKLATLTGSAALLIAAVPAQAQTITGSFLSGCGFGSLYSTARFDIFAATGPVDIASLQLTLQGGSLFLPLSGSTTSGVYTAVDDFGPFAGFSDLSNGGATLFADIEGTLGFPFSLGALSSGYFEVDVAAASASPTLQLQYAGTLSNGGTFSGSTNPLQTAVPEPGSFALLTAGAAVLVALKCRRA